MMEILLDCEDVAACLKLSTATIKKMVRQEQLPCIKLKKGLRFIASELEDWFGRRIDKPENYHLQ
jgi:predicted DNA-binding transcriptional regulator AlpA